MALAIFATQLSLDAMGDPKLERLLAYWQSRRRDGHLPRRKDLLPEEMAELVGRIKLVDVHGHPPEFSYRLFGTVLSRYFGQDLTGHSVDDVAPESLRTLVKRHLEEVVQTQTPICHEITIAQHGKSCRYRCLLLPLTLDGGRIDIVLGAANWDTSSIRVADLWRAGGAR